MFRFKSQVVVHIVAWLIFMMLPFITMPGPEGTTKIITVIQTKAYWVSLAVYIFVFYTNYNLLIPKLYLAKKYILYTISIMCILVLAYFLKHSVDFPRPRITAFGEMGGFPPGGRPSQGGPFQDSTQRFNDTFVQFGDTLRAFPPRPGDNRFGMRVGPPMHHQVDPFAIFLLCTIWALSTATRVIQQMGATEKRAAKAEADKANAELSFLKAQINPHFLFNTLNNIYSLAVRQSENTADCIMKLSNIMRYVTDEVNRDLVPLESEVECITDYISLQRLRLNKKVQVDFSVSGSTDGKRIPPLVLMTFVENVFKYGISSHEPSAIVIKIFAEEKTISFFCQNRLFATERKAERTGIGIINTRQRLEHLYPNRHLLNITTGDGFYTVELTLQA